MSLGSCLIANQPTGLGEAMIQRRVEGKSWKEIADEFALPNPSAARKAFQKATGITDFKVKAWELRNRADHAACALFDRHYSRRPASIGKRNCVGPCRHLVFVAHDETAVWATTWPKFNQDGLDVWRCSIFRNEGEATSSDLIRAAMQLTAVLWPDRPTAPAGWATFIDRRKVASTNPGYCFKKAGWWVDPEYQPGRRRRHLIRLRAVV